MDLVQDPGNFLVWGALDIQRGKGAGEFDGVADARNFAAYPKIEID